MDLNPDASAVAMLDAICDEYEQALRSHNGQPDKDETLHPDRWVKRVPVELQSWLRDELDFLRDEILIQNEPRELSRRRVPEGVAEKSWDAVANCATWSSLCDEAKLDLAKSLRPCAFANGHVLLCCGEPASGLFLLTRGKVEIVVGGEAERHELDTDGPGAVLGEMSLLTGYPCSADVIARGDIEALRLSVEDFAPLRSRWPEIEIAMSQLVSDRLGRRDHDALCGKELDGYRLDRCIGRGAMGVIYAATHLESNARVALKMLRHRFIYNPDVISRFDQEIELLQQLQHQNIVALRDHFVAYRTRFIVLELYDGADLRAVIRDHGPLPESIARRVLGQIAAGLNAAHAGGVTHLDLKPANVLLNREGRIAITDFGLARLIESDGCHGEMAGTPAYMPPEQFLMANLGPHCDWYAFGCLAYQILTGQPLFDSLDSAQFLDNKLRTPSEDWPPLTVDPPLAAMIRATLQPVVEQRRLDLHQIAKWAEPVPELASRLAEHHFSL